MSVDKRVTSGASARPGGGGRPNATGCRMPDHPQRQITGISKRVGWLDLCGLPRFLSSAALSRSGPKRSEASRTSPKRCSKKLSIAPSRYLEH